MTYKVTPEKSQGQARTIKVEVPPIDEAWAKAREQNQHAADTTIEDQFANFEHLTAKLVAVPKREATRAANDAKAREMLRESGNRHASGDLGQPDDPQGLNDRIEKLKRS